MKKILRRKGIAAALSRTLVHFPLRRRARRPRFHLEGVEAGRQVWVFKIDPVTGERLELLTIAQAGKDGWVDLDEPITVRPGDAFVAEPEPLRLNPSPARLIAVGISLAAVLAIVGYLCGLAQGEGNQLILAGCCAAAGAFVVLLGYGPIAVIIGPLGFLAKRLGWKRRVKRDGD
jgi:hypothetical protein